MVKATGGKQGASETLNSFLWYNILDELEAYVLHNTSTVSY